MSAHPLFPGDAPLTDEELAALRELHQEAEVHTPSESPATLPPPPSGIPDLALEQDILGRFVGAAHRLGVVGEDRLIATEYLAMTSRVQDKPVSLVIKGA